MNFGTERGHDIMPFIFRQSTGAFLDPNGLTLETGYSGRSEGRCNAAMQDCKGIGPIPQGGYRIGLGFTDIHKGPVVMRLTPDAANVMFGRAGFLIHGNNAANDASEGCIILGHATRVTVDQSADKRLLVMA
jgi:hypothetical protein